MFTEGIVAEPGLEAHTVHQNELAGYVGDMAFGIAFPRFVRGIDFMHGVPKRASVLATDHAHKIVNELELNWDLAQEMGAGKSSACQIKAKDSHITHTGLADRLPGA